MRKHDMEVGREYAYREPPSRARRELHMPRHVVVVALDSNPRARKATVRDDDGKEFPSAWGSLVCFWEDLQETLKEEAAEREFLEHTYKDETAMGAISHVLWALTPDLLDEETADACWSNGYDRIEVNEKILELAGVEDIGELTTVVNDGEIPMGAAVELGKRLAQRHRERVHAFVDREAADTTSSFDLDAWNLARSWLDLLPLAPPSEEACQRAREVIRELSTTRFDQGRAGTPRVPEDMPVILARRRMHLLGLGLSKANPDHPLTRTIEEQAGSCYDLTNHLANVCKRVCRSAEELLQEMYPGGPMPMWAANARAGMARGELPFSSADILPVYGGYQTAQPRPEWSMTRRDYEKLIPWIESVRGDYATLADVGPVATEWTFQILHLARHVVGRQRAG